MQQGLLQFLQSGKFAFVEASEVLGVYAQVVGGLLAVFNAGIAQQAGESEGQQKLSGLMQDSELPRRWPCWEGRLDTTLQISGGLGVEMRTGLPLAVRCIWLFGGQTHKQALSPYLTALLKRSSTRKEVAEVLVIVY